MDCFWWQNFGGKFDKVSLKNMEISNFKTKDLVHTGLDVTSPVYEILIQKLPSWLTCQTPLQNMFSRHLTCYDPFIHVAH